MRTVLALTVLLATAAPAAAALQPATGAWEGKNIRARVVKGDAGFAFTQVNAGYADRCTHPETGETRSTEMDANFRRIPIARDGSFSATSGKAAITGKLTSRRRATGTLTVAPGAAGCTGATVSFVIAALDSATPAPTAQQAPVLESFRALGRIASGRVAGYDLREEAEDFQYRIRADRVAARVQRRSSGTWVTLGTVKARPPAPLNFWPIFSRMGNGTYRILARAQSGKRFSKPRIVRFEVVSHIPHSD